MSDQERITLMKEYGLSQDMHNYYGHLVWEIASILVGGSIAGLALVVSYQPRPSMSVSFFAFAVIAMAIVFFLVVRRYREITFVHLVRCREIEARIGFLQQHRYVQRAACESFCVRRQDGREEMIREIPSPTGWEIVQWLCIALMIFGLVIAIYYLPICK